MTNKRKLLVLAVAVFMFAFCWELFFTYGFHFFWEDFDMYRLQKDVSAVSPALGDGVSPLKALGGFFVEAFNPVRFLHMGIGQIPADRPYSYLIWSFLTSLFGDTVGLFRIFKSLGFALNACMIFFLIKRVNEKLAFVGFALYLTSSEIWLNMVYSCDMSIYAQCGMLIAILVFLKMIQRVKPAFWYISSKYLLIFLASSFPILTKCDGRYLALLLFSFVLLFRMRDVGYHVPGLTVLFLSEIPLLGYFFKAMGFIKYAPIDMPSHDPLSFSATLASWAGNFRYPLKAIGVIAFIVIVFILVSWAIVWMVRLNNKRRTQPLVAQIRVQEGTALFAAWFLASLVMTAVARNFKYFGPFDIQLIDLSFLVAPFILMLCYLITLVSAGAQPWFRKVFMTVCIILLAMQGLFNFFRLNQFRGGWGNYFCSWQNAERYIDSVADNALVLSVNRMGYKPFLFRHTNNIVRNALPPIEASPFGDLRFIEAQFLEGGFKNVFVVGYGRQQFREASDKIRLIATKDIVGDCGDAYDWFKNKTDLYNRVKGFLGWPESLAKVYVYHFQAK